MSTLPLIPARGMRRSFSDAHCENWKGSWRQCPWKCGDSEDLLITMPDYTQSPAIPSYFHLSFLPIKQLHCLLLWASRCELVYLPEYTYVSRFQGDPINRIHFPGLAFFLFCFVAFYDCKGQSDEVCALHVRDETESEKPYFLLWKSGS